MALTDVSNILIYVSDALRWDALPEDARDRGVTFKTVANSTFSAPSFATLSTGLYPQEHGVMAFHQSVPESTPMVFDIDGINGSFFQQSAPELDNPIYDVLRRTEAKSLAELESPFVYMERDMLTHAPHDEDETSPSYWRSRGDDWDRIRAEYESSVDKSMARLQERLDTLEKKGELENTLVVITGDHGELLGEHGEVAHCTPLVPELAYVPTVFVHPDLSESDFEVDPETEIIEHVDVVETAVNAAGHDGTLSTSGTDILHARRDTDYGYCTVTYPKKSITFIPLKGRFTERPKWNLSKYRADGLFWHDSSHVITRGSKSRRALWMLHRLVRSAHAQNLRPQARELPAVYLPEHRTYGTPPVSLSEARGLLQTLRDGLGTGDADSRELDPETEQQLEDLGYA